MPDISRVIAVLGPTNTGKTHYALERMLGYRTGIIGLPLRLLAREIFDKIVALRGPSVVALVTGEERIIPPRAKYWVCTVEAMPEGLGCDFLAVDEIQLCADLERGHVFTDRLLRARGLKETVFMGADTIRPAIKALVPGVEIQHRERLSQLSYLGSRKISRMPPRSAIVGFSVDQVYAIAELIRRLKGGAAVVMGALSPRTRNAQVELYQSGQVDYLVATDAIGMGLNLDIHHVAFSDLHKFDGRRLRALEPHEMAQIAGRAGRGMRNGSFGITGDATSLREDYVEAILAHRFTPLHKLQWRNASLGFGSIAGLIYSLDQAPEDQHLTKAREADDLRALRILSERDAIRARTKNTKAVQLLWQVCRVPDFRGISAEEHADLLEKIFVFLYDDGRIADGFMAQQMHRINRTEGGIDTISRRLSYIRTWTYVAQRAEWVDDESHWRAQARSVEDRLSDALHARLTQRFVDRRRSILMRRLKQKEALLAEVNDKGDVTIEGELIGRVDGFQFHHDAEANRQETKTIKAAAVQALAPYFHLKADRFYNAPDTELDFTEQGGLMWGSDAVGKLVVGDDPLKPKISVFVDDAAGAEVKQKVERRLQHFIDRKIAALFEPLFLLQREEALSGLARGFGFQLVEAMGLLARANVANEVKALDQEARGALRKHGVRFGQFTIFIPALLKPAPTRLRLVLWALWQKLEMFPEAPPAGHVTTPYDAKSPQGHDLICGYRSAGQRAIRVDMLERLADMLRNEDSRAGFEAKAEMLSITGLSLEQFSDLMQGLGYAAEKGTRPKIKLPLAEKSTQTADDAVPDSAAETKEAVVQNQPGPELEARAAEMVANLSSDLSSEKGEGAKTIVPEELAKNADASRDDEIRVDLAVAHEKNQTAASEAPMEIFYRFTWPRPRRPQHQGQRKQGGSGRSAGAGGKSQEHRMPHRAKDGNGKPHKPRQGKKHPPQGPKKFQSRPPKADKIDPDNPFAAALMGLRNREG